MEIDIDRIAGADLREDLMCLADEGNDITVARIVERPVGVEDDIAPGSHDVSVKSRYAQRSRAWSGGVVARDQEKQCCHCNAATRHKLS